jgi:hypothetical protein
VANSLLTVHGPLGHTTEVLSGAYNETLSTGSPHQIWSSAMVISPLLRGMMGLDADAPSARLTFAPHVPADWTHFALRNVHVGQATCELAYSRSPASRADEITLMTKCEGQPTTIMFSPALSLRARVDGVTIDGSAAKFRVDASAADEHVVVEIRSAGHPVKTMIRLHDDFGLSMPIELPLPGEPSRNIKAISETWSSSRDQVVLEFAGLAGHTYEVPVRGNAAIRTVTGAQLANGNLQVRFPGGSTGYSHTRVTVTFAGQ